MERNDIRLLPLFALGVAKGGYEVYAKPFIKEVRPSTLAWAGILGGALLYDALAPEHETLTERFEDFSREHPVLGLGALALTVGHLTDTIRDDRDIFHLVANRIRR